MIAFKNQLVLRMHRASEMGPRQAPELHAMVAALAERAGIPKPRVLVIPQEQPNAFAAGRIPQHGAAAVTEGSVRLLHARELRGVSAPELAHIKNRGILIASSAAAAASIMTHAAQALTEKVASWFSTHPSTAERDRRLRAMVRPAVHSSHQRWIVSRGW